MHFIHVLHGNISKKVLYTECRVSKIYLAPWPTRSRESVWITRPVPQRADATATTLTFFNGWLESDASRITLGANLPYVITMDALLTSDKNGLDGKFCVSIVT